MIPLVKCFAIALFLFLTSYTLKGQEPLPIGTNLPAISLDHFPDRIDALVWRNWNLVIPARIAKTIGCKDEEINKIAASMGLPIAQQFAQNPQADSDDVLNGLANKRYGSRAVPLARKAWTAFSNAFEEFPYSGSVLYRGPQQFGPSDLLFEKPTGYASTTVGFPYDDLDGWRGQYPRDTFVSQFNKVASGWKEGLKALNEVIDLADPERRAIAREDLYLAEAVYLHFASTANQGRFVIARDSLLTRGISDDQWLKLEDQIDGILNNEVALAKALLKITEQDSRIGFEATNQYYYVWQDLIEKVINCEYIRKTLLHKKQLQSWKEEIL